MNAAQWNGAWPPRITATCACRPVVPASGRIVRLERHANLGEGRTQALVIGGPLRRRLERLLALPEQAQAPIHGAEQPASVGVVGNGRSEGTPRLGAVRGEGHELRLVVEDDAEAVRGAHAPAIGTTGAEGGGIFLLALDGIAQAGGVAMLVAGIVAEQSVLVRNDAKSNESPDVVSRKNLARTDVKLGPGPGVAGLSLVGRM